MKATLKSVAAALSVLAVVIAVLMIVDADVTAQVAASKTYIKVTVVDLDDNPVHNATVTVGDVTFNTDNKGRSPAIELNALTNSYDPSIEEWKTATVIVRKEGFVTAVNFNCVAYVGQTRKLTVRLYNSDASDLPYVVYVESPPDEYVRGIIAQ